ncbi:MAG TPA: cation-translocating P-type ATPase [Bacillota bacterium]
MIDIEKIKWYQKQAKAIAAELESDLNRGLTQEKVLAKREQYGTNELAEQSGKSLRMMLLGQFKEFLVILLLIAAVLSGFLGEWLDSTVILIIVVLNAFLGVFQEYKAEKSLEALKKLAAPLAKVLRDGKIHQIPAREMVPGDIFILEAGDFVPADGRLLEVVNLKVEESALTGESVPVDKNNAVYQDELPLADQKNSVFMGTIVTYGRGKAIVTETGMRTEIGRIATMIQNVEPETTPLQEKLGEFGKYLGLLALVVCAVIFIFGWLRGEPVMTMFLTAVSLAVAAIPEGLPAVVTIVLALGVQRMAKQRAIIRKLPAVETLGAATVICSDKTGTLTQNQMTVKKIYAGGNLYEVTGQGYQPEGQFMRDGKPYAVPEEGILTVTLLAGALCNDSNLDQDPAGEKTIWKIIGDPTEGALVVAAAKAGLERRKLANIYPRVLEIPFDSNRKLMTTIHQGSLPEHYLKEMESDNPAGLWAITKGAPDLILQRCQAYLTQTGIKPLENSIRKELLQINARMAQEALRVLGVAVRRMPEASQIRMDRVEEELIFVGFWGMIDPPRLEVKDSIAECRSAGILPVMITGDHRDTAAAIASELGLLTPERRVLTGPELDQLSEADLKAQIESIAVYARVSPENKVRIVSAFRDKGQIVAMTGDGVNDAPALKRADIGAAMGITGTDVAKSAAEMVLADDNFATIVGAVKEGRIIYENIKKAIYFLLSCNLGEIFAIFLAIILQYPVPLLAIQILWVNLVTDSLPALAMGMEPAEPGIMKRKPRRKTEGIFEVGIKLTLFFEGLLIGGFTLISFAIGSNFGGNLEQGRTMAFATLSFSQLFHVFNFRSIHATIFKRGMLPNPFLWGAVAISALVQLIVMLIPLLREIFKLTALDGWHWLIVWLLSATTIPVAELWKATYLRRCGKQS